ncbi:hypothetical protein BKK51_11505 [Rodentibacter trehalosifermentans]|uniref:Uncharacterized protein n=1 Tax=Rodentibacter trehalosifermentans TaxID=1908263 RepID=A0A1V3IN01_9PAST|nr:hypothetical protein [Rodentibacter trehalosifermentans]OOF43459.1 hypothetical protein BKK51_11505 [Rodentibacter trehalosifermentans]
MALKYKGFDFIGFIGVCLSAYGIFQNNENNLLLAGWFAALLLWIGHIIDSLLSYNLHSKREQEIDKLKILNDKLNKTISSLQVELNTSKRTIENQQYMITQMYQNNETSYQPIPRQTN